MNTCERCGEKKEDVIDGLCEECEQDTVYCSVCDCLIDNDDAMYRHRHLFYDNGLWLGTGGEDTEDHLSQVKMSFLALLRKTGMAIPLRDTIRRNDMGFETIHFHGSMLGRHDLWCYLRANDSKYGYDYGDALPARITAEEEERLAYGVQWLIGLDNEKTPVANEMTLAWIDELLKEDVTQREKQGGNHDEISVSKG